MEALLFLHLSLLGELVEQRKWGRRNTWVWMKAANEERASGDQREKVHGVVSVIDSSWTLGFLGKSWSLVSSLKRDWGAAGLLYSGGSIHVDFYMTGALWVCAVCSLCNHIWLPCHISQSSLLKISGNVPDPFLPEPCALGFGFLGKVIFLLKSSWEVNWTLDYPEKSDPQSLS